LTFAFGIRNYILYDALRKIYRLLKKITFGRPESKAARLSAAALRATVPLLNSDPAKTVSAMERRRASNIEKMRKIDLVIAPSKKAAAILKFFAGTRPPVIVIPHALEHISHIRPLVMDEIRGRLNFVVLNAFSGPYKGSELVLSAVEILNGKGLEGKFLLHIYGSMEEGIRPKALKWRNVIYHGLYDTKALDRILDGKHVGIVPSLCDETLCITGLEMLAKGIPVIGNDIGGISDYVTDGVTGWLNKGLSAEGLASIMERIINDPAQVSALNRKTVENAGRFSKKIDSHVSEIGEVYKTVIEKNGSDGQ
jgi:glycosyltransferase involved in cell wall biosynthesis